MALGVDQEKHAHSALLAPDRMILDEERLRGATGMGQSAFFYTVAAYESAASGFTDASPFGGGQGAPKRSNETTPYMLYAFLYHIRSGCPLAALQGAFGVDRTAIVKTVSMVRGIMANTGMLPTPCAIAGEMSSLPRGKLAAALAPALA